MPRDLVLSNGHFHVALDARYAMRDAYWPHVGHANHAVGHRSRFGVATRGQFAWVHARGWNRRLRYASKTLVAESTLRSPRLGVTLACRDAILPDGDVLVREVTARAKRDAPPSEPVDLFFHLDLHVDGTDIGDTVMHDAATGGLVHYKRDRYFLQNGTPLQGFACGRKEFGDSEGTWRDAEDGALSGNPVAHGACDGVVQLRLTPEAPTAYWWVAAGPDLESVQRLDAWTARDPLTHLVRAETWWRTRTRRGPTPRGLGARLVRFYRQSLALALAHCDHAGGIVAATDSDILSFNRDTYAYVWPRDAAFIAHALDVAGHPEPVARLLRFLSRVAHPDGWLGHKATVDGHAASTWHVPGKGAPLAIQEDETALATWAFAEHVRLTEDYEIAVELYAPLARRACEWMLAYRDEDGLPLPSWDPWEERWGVHAYTAATVIAALEAAAELADRVGEHTEASRWRQGAGEVRAGLERFWSRKHGRYARRITPDGELDVTEDASLVMLAWLPVLHASDKRVRATLDHVFERLTVKTDVGGVARYVDDVYHRVDEPDGKDVATYPGNPWIVTTLWHADWLAMTDRREEARRLFAWVADRARPSGVLAEQLHPRTGAPLSVSPLAWSHAAVIESCRRFTEPRLLVD